MRFQSNKQIDFYFFLSILLAELNHWERESRMQVEREPDLIAN